MKTLDDIFPKDFVERRKREYEESERRAERKSDFWDILAEGMSYGGFGFVQAVLDDYLTIDQANSLLLASRRFYNQDVYNRGVAHLAAVSASRKSPFNKTMEHFVRGMK